MQSPGNRRVEDDECFRSKHGWFILGPNVQIEGRWSSVIAQRQRVKLSVVCGPRIHCAVFVRQYFSMVAEKYLFSRCQVVRFSEQTKEISYLETDLTNGSYPYCALTCEPPESRELAQR